VSRELRSGTCEVCGGATGRLLLRGGDTLARCADCGHLTRDLADAPADHRDHAYGGEPTLDAWRLALTHRLLTRNRTPPRSVFEIGYGSGALLRRFLDAGATVAGTDPDQLEVAVDPLVRERGDLHTAPIEELTSAGDPVDLVYGIHVLEHVLDPMRTLQHAADLLAPGGIVQFLTPAGDSDGLRTYGRAWWMLEDPTHVRFFTAESLRRAAVSVGLTDVRVTRPALDSLVTDVASLTRLIRPRPRPHGVLAQRSVLAAGVATAPLVLAARAARPASRPTLHLTARRVH
jgi:SAM-dependent methyltransferase